MLVVVVLAAAVAVAAAASFWPNGPKGHVDPQQHAHDDPVVVVVVAPYYDC